MYQVSVTYVQNLDADKPLTGSSLDRFVRASRELPAGKAPSTKPSRSSTTSRKAGYTQWSIVYDIAEKRAIFARARSATFRFLDVDAFDCHARRRCAWST
jgi:hypothetical protein